MRFGSPRPLICLAVASSVLALAPPAWADDGGLPGSALVPPVTVEVAVTTPAASVSVEVSASADPAPAVQAQASAAAPPPSAPVPPPVEPAATVTVSVASRPAREPVPASAAVDVKAGGAAISVQTPSSSEDLAAGGTGPAAAASRPVVHPYTAAAKTPTTGHRAAGTRVSSPRSAMSRAQAGDRMSAPLGPDKPLRSLPHRAPQPGSRIPWAPATDRIADAAASIRAAVPAPPAPSFPHQPGTGWSAGAASGGTGPLILLGLLVTLVCLAPPGVRGGLVLLGTALGLRPYGLPLERPG